MKPISLRIAPTILVVVALPGCASTPASSSPRSVAIDVAPPPAPVETAFRGALTVDATSLGPDEIDAGAVTKIVHGEMKAFVGCLRHEAAKPVDAWVAARVDAEGIVDFTATDSSVPKTVAPCLSSVAKGLKFDTKTFAVSVFLHAEPAPADCKGDDCVFIPAPSETTSAGGPDVALEGDAQGGVIGILATTQNEGAFGTLQGADAGETFGVGGLGLTGLGEGGGGRGEGIGLGTIGTLGRGSGGQGLGTLGVGGSGFGNGRGRLSGSHRAKVPVLRAAPTSVSGRLPPEVIQRIVRQHFGQFRRCYEKGLETDPKLEGMIETTFIIGRGGDVTSVSDGKSDLPSGPVRQCVQKVFAELKFPQPEGGVVRVTYPLKMSPGEDPPPPPVFTVGGAHFPALGPDAVEKKLKGVGWHTLAVPADKPGAPFAVFALKEGAPSTPPTPGDGFATSVTWGPADGPRADVQRDSEGMRLRFDGPQANALDHDVVDAEPVQPGTSPVRAP